MTVNAIPDGYHSVSPYLIVDDAGALLDFLTAAFDGEERERIAMPSGQVMHAEIRIGNSMVMMGGARPGADAAKTSLYLYVEQVDAVYRQALAAGAVSVMAPADQFYGDRNAGITDPAGNTWWIATHIEDVPPAELQRRAREQMSGD